MLPVTNIPRPTFASVHAEVIEPDVLHWISLSEKRIGKAAYKTFIDALPSAHGDFGRLLHSACASRDDAFAICEDLKSILEWPVDADLVELFIKGKTTAKTLLRARTIEWVMKTGTRFKQKPGDSVTFQDNIAKTKRMGTVRSVDRAVASGLVEYSVSGDHHKMTVFAEDLRW